MNAAVDLLKAYAIIGVLWQHAVPATYTDAWHGNLWVRPAVPVFFILLGYNQGQSMRRSSAPLLSSSFLRPYAASRFDRIVVPLLPVLLVAYLVAAVRGTLRPQPSLVIGGFPVDAPGNYFIPALLGALVLLPLLEALRRRSSVGLLVGCFALDIAFEVLAALLRDRVELLAPSSIVYQGCPLRWLALLAIGLWLAASPALLVPRNAWLVVLAVPSLVYLVLLQVRPGSMPFPSHTFLSETNVLAAPWSAVVCIAGLALLPHSGRATTVRALQRVGRASYHIFLVQMLWMGLVLPVLWGDRDATPPGRLSLAAFDVLASLGLGLLYHRLVPGGPGLRGAIVRQGAGVHRGASS